jgi:hypothetical protein
MACLKFRPKCDWKWLVEIEERLRKWSSFNNIRKWLANGYQTCVGKHPSRFYSGLVWFNTSAIKESNQGKGLSYQILRQVVLLNLLKYCIESMRCSYYPLAAMLDFPILLTDDYAKTIIIMLSFKSVYS